MKNYLKGALLLGSLFIVGCSSLVEKKEQANIIIKNGTLLTMNEKREIIENGVIVIKNNKIILMQCNTNYTGEKENFNYFLTYIFFILRLIT